MASLSTSTTYIDRYQNNYELWMKEICGAEITTDQRKLAKGLIEEHFVSGKSGTTTGKTTCSATTALWFLTTHPESKIPCTAPTGHQLEDLLFAEMESWIRRIKYEPMRNAIEVIKGKIYIRGFRDWFIAARTIPRDSKDKLGDVLAGFHAPHLLFIIDEASGVPDSVFKGIEGSMIQKNVYCLMVGNPTRNVGYFYDSHHKNRKNWCCVTLSSLRSPFVDLDWVDRMRDLHGEDSDFFRTKILGEFPIGGGGALVTIDEIHEAFYRHKHTNPDEVEGKLVAGLDPAAGRRDHSILTLRKGGYIIEPIQIKHCDTVELIPKVHKICIDRGVRELYTDYVGLGINIYDSLRRKSGYKTFKVVANARANDPEAYKNLRAELYILMRDNFGELAIPDHDRYIMELPEIEIIPDKVPLQIVDKATLRNRLGFSPDYSDSAMISLFRNANFGSQNSGNYENISGFMQANNQLEAESSFEKF